MNDKNLFGSDQKYYWKRA